jgi:hypothetical protein
MDIIGRKGRIKSTRIGAIGFQRLKEISKGQGSQFKINFNELFDFGAHSSKRM